MATNFKRLFGQRVAALRNAQNLKQHQLATRIGKKDRYVSAIEIGKTFPRPEMIPLLARALNVPINSLFFFEGMDNDAVFFRGAMRPS